MQRQRRDETGYVRKIEFAFYNEELIRDAVEEARWKVTRPELKNGSGLSDPTAFEAIRHLTPIEAVTVKGVELKKPEKWLLVIDKTYEWCKRRGEIYFNVASGRYEGRYFADTCVESAISESQYYLMLERIRHYAALQAVQNGLIYVD